MRIVVALGGNALLKRGEPLEVQCNSRGGVPAQAEAPQRVSFGIAQQRIGLLERLTHPDHIERGGWWR